MQDEQKADDELAKKRAAFLLKQQRKAEEARVRRQQLEAEVGSTFAQTHSLRPPLSSLPPHTYTPKPAPPFRCS